MPLENQHGGKRDGAGRPRGSLNKRSLAAIEAVAERWPDWTPLEHFAKVANDETLDAEIRLDAAKAAAGFMHAKLKPICADADEVVELEGRIVAARVAAAAKVVGENPGLAERLERARLHLNNDFEMAVAAAVASTTANPSRVIDLHEVKRLARSDPATEAMSTPTPPPESAPAPERTSAHAGPSAPVTAPEPMPTATASLIGATPVAQYTPLLTWPDNPHVQQEYDVLSAWGLD